MSPTPLAKLQPRFLCIVKRPLVMLCSCHQLSHVSLERPVTEPPQPHLLRVQFHDFHAALRVPSTLTIPLWCVLIARALSAPASGSVQQCMFVGD